MAVIVHTKPTHRSIGPWHQKLKAYIYVYKTLVEIYFKMRNKTIAEKQDLWDAMDHVRHMVTMTKFPSRYTEP